MVFFTVLPSKSFSELPMATIRSGWRARQLLKLTTITTVSRKTAGQGDLCQEIYSQVTTDWLGSGYWCKAPDPRRLTALCILAYDIP